MKSGFVLITMLVASLFCGCSKEPQASTNDSAPRTVNLGTIEFSPGQSITQDAGEGLTCKITTTVLDPTALQVVVVLLKGDKEIASSRVAPALPNQPLHMTMGGLSIDFIPRIK